MRGLPVFDADAVVHRLQAGPALPAISRAFPGAVRHNRLDRAALRRCVIGDEAAMRQLEAILHPLVRLAERAFLARARRAGRRLVVLDIPLLLETGGAARVDWLVVVSAPPGVQRARVRQRRQLTDAQITALIARQMPDAEKRRRADWLIRTGLSRAQTQRTIRRLLPRLRDMPRPMTRRP